MGGIPVSPVAMSVMSSLVNALTFRREERKPLFERLMKETSRQAYGVAYRLTGNETEAEELVQETYVRAFRFFHRYDENLPFASWIYRIMTNIHIDASRRRQRIKFVSMELDSQDGTRTMEIADESAKTDAGLWDQILEEPLQMGLKAMNPEFRTALVLADVEGFAYEEVAEMMGTTVGTVRSRIHRARKILKEYILQQAPHLAPREEGK